MAVDADSVERSGSTVTIRELYVATRPAHMPPASHDYLTRKIVVDCDARTSFTHSYAFFAFGRPDPVSRSPGATATRAVNSVEERRHWRAACTDFLQNGDTATAEEWARILILRMRAADNWQDPLMIQDWRVSRPTGDGCMLSGSFGDSTHLSVTLDLDGREAFSLIAPVAEGKPPSWETSAVIGVQESGGEWKEVFRGLVDVRGNAATGQGRVLATAPGLVSALETAQDFALVGEGLPPQGLQVGPMDRAVASLRACTLGSRS
ncbi:MAG TPA: hypothetical protein VFF66_03130 [Brevundimonas sp.]|nr:hypothetical protein [Brevundimonas sp.]